MTRFSKIAGEMVPHEMIERRIEELGHLDNLVAVAARPDERKGEQSPMKTHTLRSGRPKVAPMAAGIPNPMVPSPPEVTMLRSLVYLK